jgi:hypothetical protein
LFSGDGSECLASRDGTEGYQKFVVDRSGIVKERADNFLNAAFTVFVKELRSLCFWSELGFSAIGDWQTLVRGETWLVWTGILNSLPAIDAHERQFFDKLLWGLVTSTIFVRC